MSFRQCRPLLNKLRALHVALPTNLTVEPELALTATCRAYFPRTGTYALLVKLLHKSAKKTHALYSGTAVTFIKIGTAFLDQT